MAIAKPSFHQQLFIDAALTGKNIVVRACAGSGKTTASLNLLWQYLEKYPENNAMYVAFQNDVLGDIRKKVKENLPLSISDRLETRTSYSLGFELLKDRHSTELDDRKHSMIISWKLGELYKRYGGKQDKLAISVYGEFEETKRILVQLYQIAQTRLVFTIRGLMEIETERQLFPYIPNAELFQVVLDAIDENKKWLEWGNWDHKKVHSFTDMVSYPACLDLQSRSKYNLILIDEAQDIGEGQLRVIEAYADTNTQWVIVGDPNQNILGFCGAIPNRMQLLKEKYNAEEFSMPLSYRVSKQVCALAKQYVPDFECLPNAPEGWVGNIGLSKSVEKMNEGDIVLARTIAQLLEVAIIALTTGKKVTFLGGNLKLQIKAALDDIKARFGFNDFIHSVNLYLEETIEFLKTKHGDNIDEQKEELTRLGNGLIGLYNYSISKGEHDFVKFVDELFVGENDKKKTPSIRFLTGHRGKGLEADTVFIVQPPNGNLPYTGSKMTPQLLAEERNLYYVMLTRSKNKLWFVVPDNTPDSEENATECNVDAVVPIVEEPPRYLTAEDRLVNKIQWESEDREHWIDVKVDYQQIVSGYRFKTTRLTKALVERLNSDLKEKCGSEEMWLKCAPKLGIDTQKVLL